MANATIKVLLVESEQDDYRLIEKLLSRARGAKFDLQWVQDFEEAGRAMAEADYDACLIDDRLGLEDGLDLVRKTLRARGDVPLIMLTRQHEYSLDVNAMHAGVRDYLIKTQLRVDLLERAIRYAIEYKRIEVVLHQTSIENIPLSSVVENLTTGVLITDPQQPDNPLVFVNPAFSAITGYSAEEGHGHNCRFLQCPHSDPITKQAIRDAISEQRVFKGVLLNQRKDGTPFWNALAINPVFNSKGRLVNYVGLMTDVTARIQAEQKMAHLAAIVESSGDAIIGKTLDGIITSWNFAAEQLYGYSEEEILGQPLALLLPPDRLNEISQIIGRLLQGEHVQSFETVRRHKSGTLLDVALTVSQVRDADGYVTGAAVIARDISQRKQQEVQIEQHIQRIQALRTIDMAISGSLDLRVTLNVLLDQVTTHLNIDSAAILLLNPHTQRLDYTAGRGFRTGALQGTHLRLGEGFAGIAALERRVVHVPVLQDEPGDLTRAPLLASEGFVSYYAVPLVVKGHVAGVLEILHRAPLHPDDAWLSFMETLAGQAAIAIDNAELFNELQVSNLELEIAYDSTLEGWSKALDLRDKETEGHTQRVAEATMTLARAMDIPDRDLIHIRRGALLHDIGKMGVPDSILLKPGALTEEEWVIMKKHPVFAYELLAPIPYLHLALDIPYCHHEKWDGSGYPRGIKGEQIPLAARLFAVIDVWDALSSDRPYRSAWDAAKVRDHIIQSSSSHFDPRVVQSFLDCEMQPQRHAATSSHPATKAEGSG
jgi:PAS domain S-box-containing protein